MIIANILFVVRLIIYKNNLNTDSLPITQPAIMEVFKSSNFLKGHTPK